MPGRFVPEDGGSVGGDGMRESELMRFTQFAVDNLADAAYWVEIDASIIYVNEAASRMTGYSMDELLAIRIHDLDPDITETTWPHVWELLQKAGRRTFEGRHQTKDGSIIPVEISANLFTFDGKEYSCAFVRDISERKQLELRLRQSEKMEAIGQLAGGVAHDFNNQLTGIMGYAELLREDVAENPALCKLADQLIRVAERSADLTAQLLAFARKGKFSSERVDIHELVGEVVAILTRSADKRIDIVTELAAAAPMVLGDSSQLQSAILNLAINACDAMPQGGQLTFTSAEIQLDGPFAAEHSFETDPGEYVCLTVSDTGIGIDAAIRGRIFEPFFTTKEEGKGTGLGLAAVYGAAKNHKGALEVESERGVGTRIHLYLPIVPKAAQLGSEGAKLESAHDSPALRVLVVEDEAAIRDMMEETLRRLGHTATVCEHGGVAVEVYTKSPAAFDLVILDLVMPVMAGPETLAKLREIDPNVRVLLISTFSTNDEAETLLAQGARGFIRKPFTRVALADKINEIVAESDDRNEA